MKKRYLLTVPALALLTACGSDSDSDSNNGGSTSTLSMAMTDAPVTNASRLMLTVDSIELLTNDDQRISIDVDQPQFDLLALQGAQNLSLFTDEEVPAGGYQWMRLHIDTESMATFLETDDGQQHALDIPSNDQTGLKVNSPFTLPANDTASFVVDFDVSKSLTQTGNGQYKLRPTLRLTDVSEIGHINGTVASEYLVDCAVPAVYAFEGTDTAFVDTNTTSEPTTGPVTSSLVSYDESTSSYEYELGFLTSGAYSLYLTCAEDDPEATDNITAAAAIGATVTTDTTTEANFTLADEWTGNQETEEAKEVVTEAEAVQEA